MKNSLIDSYIGAPYVFEQFPSAKELSKTLKSVLKKKKIDFTEYNTEKYKESWRKNEKDESIANTPPVEIYEYQNFFILKDNQDILLLDGFRRLLWYNAPDTPVWVRLYDRKDLSDKQILSLLVYLNHFKFYGSSGQYYDRGFALLLKTVFNLDILPYKKAFNAYLTSDKLKNEYYSSSSGEENITVKSRILNDHFVSDIRFIQEAKDSGGVMVNEFFGALVFAERVKSKEDFNFKQFKKLHDENEVLPKLIERFAKVGTNNSADSTKVVNQIMEVYKNLFTIMAGGEVEKTYAEHLKDCKELSEKLKKDKGWTKLTGLRDIYKAERLLMKICKKDPSRLKFKCVIFPDSSEIERWSKWDAKDRVYLKPGLREDISFIKFTKPSGWGQPERMVFGFKEHGVVFTLGHNYNGKKYVKVESHSFLPIITYNADIYVNLSKSEWENE